MLPKPSPPVRQEPRNLKRTFQGIPLVIEYLKGDRKPDKKAAIGDFDWGYVQYADYGYIPGTTSNEEGEGLDVFIGPVPESQRVFLAALMDKEAPDCFTEYKVLLGFECHKDAKDFAEYQYMPGMIGFVYEMTIEDLLDWCDLQKPMAEKLTMRLEQEEEQAPHLVMMEREREPALVIQS